MKQILLAVLAAGGLVLLGGCISTVDGQMKPGMPLSKDTIEARYERPADQVFQAARKVLSFRGTLTGENTIAKTLEARVDTRTVRVAVDEVEPNITRCRVQVRTKSGGGDVELASQLSTEIALGLK